MWSCPLTFARVTETFRLGSIATHAALEVQRWRRVVVPTKAAHHRPLLIMVLVQWKYKHALSLMLAAGMVLPATHPVPDPIPLYPRFAASPLLFLF